MGILAQNGYKMILDLKVNYLGFFKLYIMYHNFECAKDKDTSMFILITKITCNVGIFLKLKDAIQYGCT